MKIRYDINVMAERKLEPVADVLNRVVRALDMERELLSHTAGPVWARTVGEKLSTHTRASQLRGGTLTVEARSAAWMNEVSLMREQIRERLNEELRGAPVREVRFRLGGGFAPLLADTRGPPPRPSEEEIEQAAKELAEYGADGARVMAKALALSRKRPPPAKP
jgi:hypothetical protein